MSITGLIDRCTIHRREPVDDGFGAVNGENVPLHENVKCRKTRVKGEEDDEPTGKSGRQLWRITTEPVDVPIVDEAGKKAIYVIEMDGQLHDVLWFEPRRTEASALHHLEFRAEVI